jgi:hypothetical protein
MQCQSRWLFVQEWWPWSLASNLRKITKEKQMETSTGELIAKLTNLSHNLALELRFKESSLVLEAVGVLHTLPTLAEKVRDSWHPSFNTSGPSKGISYISSVKMVDADE